MDRGRKIGLLSSNIDYWTVLVYLVLVVMGWFTVYSVQSGVSGFWDFEFSARYAQQLLWIGISFSLAVAILLIDSKYFHIFAYQIYWIAVVLMLVVIVVGREVNGAKSWIGVGGMGIQPVEFMKIATALALSKFMSAFNFSFSHRHSVLAVCFIIFLPVLLILLQNDTGSALIFSAFFVVLFREGYGSGIYLLTIFWTVLAVLTFFVSPEALLLLVVVACLLYELYCTRSSRGLQRVLWFVALYLSVLLLWSLLGVWWGFSMGVFWMLFWPLIVVLLAVVGYGLKLGQMRYIGQSVVVLSSLFVVYFVDYAFDHVLQPHHQVRILNLVGLKDDPQGIGYNAMQSKIAIGSGGMWGKGYMEGTQTRFSFVPEQSTDFIFCTVGEEWGFMGSLVVVLLFGLLIYRVMLMGERAKEPFARIYCYCTAAILAVHFLINISMTLGLFPIIGIPLPFFSYGGSSHLAFSVMLFIAIRLDSLQWEGASRRLM